MEVLVFTWPLPVFHSFFHRVFHNLQSPRSLLLRIAHNRSTQVSDTPWFAGQI